MGKAKQLRRRLQSYLRLNQLSSRIREMVQLARHVKYQVLTSELSALLTEAELIRTYQPPYNVLLKDDKSPLYIILTQDEFPYVKNIRKKELATIKPQAVFGPFQSGYQVKQVLQIARPLFRWCDQPGNKEKKPCFYFHLELCDGACCGLVTAQTYHQSLKQLQLFLRGRSTQLIASLTKQRNQQAKLLQYEVAGETQAKITALTAITKTPYQLRPDPTPISLQASPSDRLKYLGQVLTEFAFIPRTQPLQRIECYDVSNISGSLAVVSQVVFIHGQPDKSQYRSFNIKSLHTPNDVGMLKEALSRRQNHPEWGTPDLVVIDGGKTQLRAALSIWRQSSVISIAKNPDRLVIPRRPATEPLSSASGLVVVKLKPNHPALLLIQALRDEAHRFAKYKHTRRRDKQLFG